MKPKDSDTFIDIGVSITRLLLIASGQGTAASLIGEGAGLLRNLRSGGQRAVSAEKIAADVFNRLPGEYQDISEADWHAAATNVAPLIDRLSEKDRLAAGYDWEALRPVLRDLGSEERRCTLADESRQAPRFAEPGKKGEIKTINLELKMIADVGLIGKPNVGKSSILSKISNANPKIGNYNFTTLSPNLGIVKIDSEHSYVVADIPGLIEGAAKGTGLGYSFLKHIERTKILVHVLDGSGLTGDPIENYYSIWKELEEYNVSLKDKNEIIVINKIDILSSKEYIKKIKEKFKDKKIIEISALKNNGIKEFIYQIWNEIKDLRNIYETYDDEYEEVVEKKSKGYNISLKDDVFFLDGDFIEDLCYRTNFDDEFSIKHFQSVLEKKGIINELKKMGIKEGQTVIVDKNEFEFIE